MAGLFAVVQWTLDTSDPSQDRAPGAPSAVEDVLTSLLRARPQASFEQRVRLAGRGGAVAVSAPGSGPALTAGAAADLGWAAAGVGADGGRIAALVASGPAAAGLAGLLAGPKGRASPLLPYPHAAILWDGEELHVWMDELGAWPLYFRRLSPRALAIGTAALPLATLSPAAELDRLAVAELLAFGQPLATRTLFAGIEALPPGARAVFGPERTAIASAIPADRPAPRRPLGAAAERIDRALAESIALVDAAKPVPAVAGGAGAPERGPGVLLSGGLDSRLVLAHLVRSEAHPRAYTFGEPDTADAELAARVAAALGVPHTFAPWTPAGLTRVLAHAVWLTDGQVAAHHLHGTDLLPALRLAAGAQWNGFAGDAILGGSFAHPRYSLPGPLPPRLFAAFNRILRKADLGRVLTPEAARALAGHPQAALNAALERIPDAPAPERARRFLLVERVGRLAAVGLALDRHYLPVAIPFATEPVLRVMHELRLAERRYGRALARSLVQSFPTLATIPWQRTGARPGTPWPWAAAIRAAARARARAGWGPAAGIADYGAWFRGPLVPLVAELLASPALHEPRLFSPTALTALAQGGLRSAREVALAGVLMSLAIALEIAGGLRAPIAELEPAPALGPPTARVPA
jgi:Asparagine synthase